MEVCLLKKYSLKNVKSHFPFIGDIRGKGLLLGIEFVETIKQKPLFLGQCW